MRSPELPGRQVAALAFLACLLTVVMNPSLLAGLGKLPADAADRMFQSWQLAWNGQGLLHQPLDFFDSNAFWPLENSVAFSDALIGFTPAGLVGSGPEAALVRYNLVFLFCYASAFFAAALLGREIGLGWPAALVAGAAFGFAPFRLTHYNHLHVLASAPIPLTLFLLLRGYRRARPGMVIAGFAIATWQVSIGFTLGVPLAYLLGLLAVVAGIVWQRGMRLPALGRPMVLATLAGLSLLVAWSGAQAVPYLRVLEEHPEAERTTDYVRFYSPPLRSFLVAPAESLLWGEPTAGLREQVTWPPEMALFPGLTVLALAAIGLLSRALSTRWRVGLAAGAASSAVLALGYSFFGGSFTYNLLYELAPGWQGSRTPGRLFTFTSLALALLAGAGVSALVNRSPGVGRSGAGGASPGPAGPGWSRRRAAAAALPAVLMLAVLAEGLGKPPLLSDPPLRALPADEPQLHLPSDDFNDFVYMFWSTAGFPDIVNGYSGFTPALLGNLRAELQQFPDAATVARLRELGVRTVVLHVDRAAGTPWAGADRRAVDGLPLKRAVEGQTVRFDLDPLPANAR